MASVAWSALLFLAVLAAAPVAPALAAPAPVRAVAWDLALNGNPASAAVVGDGEVRLGAAAGSDSPYASATPFPTTGDLVLSFTIAWPQKEANGVGLVVLGAGNRAVMSAWSDRTAGVKVALLARLGDVDPTAFDLDASLPSHDIRLGVAGRTLKLWADGSTLKSVESDLRPERVWVGMPSVGQLLGLDPDGARPRGVFVDATGHVTERWWGGGAGRWSEVEVTSIQVDVPEPARSAPAAGPLAAALVLGLAAALRRR